MPNMCLWIFIGSGIGGVVRYLFSGFVASSVGEVFPWGTLLINITGSFAIGLFATLTGPDGRYLASPVLRQFVMIGLFGGYTTFSSFSLQTLNLVHSGDYFRAFLNVALSILLCLVAVWGGAVAAAAFNSLKGS